MLEYSSAKDETHGPESQVEARMNRVSSPSWTSRVRVADSVTRTREVHDGLDTRFILSSTWLSGPWVSSFAEEYSNIYYLDAARREEVLSRWRGESEKYVSGLLYTSDAADE